MQLDLPPEELLHFVPGIMMEPGAWEVGQAVQAEDLFECHQGFVAGWTEPRYKEPHEVVEPTA